jgi:hypothetical protein
VQRTIGNQVLQQTSAERLKGEALTSAPTRFVHNFSQISVYAKKPVKIQTKLTVSSPEDQYEQEADRVADSVIAGDTQPIGQVSQGIQPKLYRVVVRPEDAVDSVLPPETESVAESPEVSQTEEVQRSASGEAGTVSPHFEQSLKQATRGGGESLPSPTRSFMESRFGWNFSSVRVHNDARANTLAREVNARAFTLENDIFFASAQYQPNSREGQHLLAHELTHVIQQSEGRLSRQIQRQTSCSSYPGYNSSAALNTYNCAGLATRTYRYITTASLTYDSIMANFNTPGSPSGNQCGAGKVKFWLWEYDMHSEDDSGTRVSPDHRDFHVVAGRADSTGADPTDVYSKNGARPVHGPGSGPSFRPATRERYLSNDSSETPATLPNGRPHFVVRSNMSQDITCAGCSP